MEKEPHQKSNLASVMKRLSQQVPSRSDLTLINQNLASLQRELVKANTNLETAEEQYEKLSAMHAGQVLEASLNPEHKQLLDPSYEDVINARRKSVAAKQAVEDLERQITQLKTLLKKT